MTWLRRNGAALLVIALAITAYSSLIVRPRWNRDIASHRPDFVIGPGDSVTIDGIDWRLRTIDPPPPGKYDAPVPADMRAWVFILERSKAGHPPSGPDVENMHCDFAVADGDGRRWNRQNHPALTSIQASVSRLGYGGCTDPGDVRVVALLPPDAKDLTVEATIQVPKKDVNQLVRFEVPSD